MDERICPITHKPCLIDCREGPNSCFMKKIVPKIKEDITNIIRKEAANRSLSITRVAGWQREKFIEEVVKQVKRK